MNERRRRPSGSLRARILAPVILGACILAGWQAVTAARLIPKVFLPAPAELAARFFSDLAGATTLSSAATTLTEALCGTLAALFVALPLGYAIARIRLIDFATTPFVAASQAIPAIATAPLLAIWIGYGLPSITVLCAITAFFPMLVTTVLGFRGIDRDVREAARLDGATRLQVLRHIDAPLAVPSIAAGLRAGAALSITGAVVGEFTMGGRGLGMLLTLYRDASDTLGLFSTLVLLVLLAVLLHTVLGLVVLLGPRETSRREAGAREADARRLRPRGRSVP